MKKTIIFFAYPGAGKDKHSKYIIDLFKKNNEQCLYINTGKILRNLKKSILKNNLNKIIKKGNLIPNYIINSIVGNILLSKLSSSKNLIFNGFPRSVEQIKFIKSMMHFFDRDVCVIFIKITQLEAFKRIKHRKHDRIDDKVESIRKRFKIFRDKESLLVPLFKEYFNLNIINGDDTPIKVHKKIVKALEIN